MNEQVKALADWIDEFIAIWHSKPYSEKQDKTFSEELSQFLSDKGYINKKDLKLEQMSVKEISDAVGYDFSDRILSDFKRLLSTYRAKVKKDNGIGD